MFQEALAAPLYVEIIARSSWTAGYTLVRRLGEAGALAAAGGTRFSFTDPKAKSVHLAGEFNKWLNAADGKIAGSPEWALQNDGAGNWTLTAPLAPGKYQYKFVIDNGARWERDPGKPVDGDNSIIEVGAAPAAGNASFLLAAPNAKAVFVAGEFNNWNATANPLKKDAGGLWTTALNLKPGKYAYKFIVDGMVNGASVVARGAAWVSSTLDKNIVDGAVNFVADGTMTVGGKLRQAQTGRVQNYALGIAIGLGLGAQQTVITLVAFAILSALIALNRMVRGREPGPSMYLTLSAPRDRSPGLAAWTAGLQRHANDLRLRRFDETDSHQEASYQVAFLDLKKVEACLQEFRSTHADTRVRLMDDRGIGS